MKKKTLGADAAAVESAGSSDSDAASHVARKYHGNWKDHAAMKDDFFPSYYTHSAESIAKLPTENELLFASYETGSYEGWAFVLFERDGKLYEVHAAHCSCYGLEGQFEPEETSWAALAIRPFSSYDAGGGRDALLALINERKAEGR